MTVRSSRIAPLSGQVAIAVEADPLDRPLQWLFAAHSGLSSTVLDERGAIRHHVAIFIDGDAVRDRQRPEQPLRANSQVYVMQALQGG